MFGLAVIAVLSLIMVGAARALLVRLDALDHPGHRSSHTIPTPRGGGLGFVIVWIGWLAWLAMAGTWSWGEFAALALASAAIAGLGLWDDLRDVPASVRLSGQLIVVLGFFLAWGGFEAGFESWVIFQVVAVLALLWLLNLYNFMDGINGIAAWEGCFVAAGLAVLAWMAGDMLLAGLAGGLAAAVAGFLPWNWPRAKVFMGDAGSTTLGFALGALGLMGIDRGTFSFWVPLLLLAAFLVDATATLLLRIWRRERWYTAHRRHTYQLLAARGYGHGRVVALYMAANFLLIAPVVWWVVHSSAIQAWACIGSYAILTILWGLARRS